MLTHEAPAPGVIALMLLAVIPLSIVLSSVLIRRSALLTRTAGLMMWLQMAVAARLCLPALAGLKPVGSGTSDFAIGHIAAVLILLTTLVAASSLTHAIGFFEREAASAHGVARRSMAQFYAFTALFVLAMYGVIAAQNLGYLWVAMEATTLLSAPLVYYHRTRTALEATWKYLIICSVGIAFAFFGTAVLYAASQQSPGLHGGSLLLPALDARAASIPRGLRRLGFVFMLLGYGAKAGLFPLHSWLPDAHSEAPAPASAMLSGALLNCALVAIWRVCALMDAAGDGRLVLQTLLPMGVLTVLAASLFLLRQRDIKRLLAYSSMENVGVMAVAIALRSSSGFLLQAVNHSLVKVALFLLAGNLLQLYGTKSMRAIRGILTSHPAQGVCLLLGTVAVAGTPPFGSFLSEWIVLSSAADRGYAATVVLVAVGLAVAFIALVVQVGSMLFGECRRGEDSCPAGRGSFRWLAAVPVGLLAISLILGVLLPPGLLK